MRRILMAALFAAALGLILCPAGAQSTNKDNVPGYMVIRVLLDGGVSGGPNPSDPNAPNAPRGNPTRSVAAVVPYQYIEKILFHSGRSGNALTNPAWPAIKHKYGMCFLFTDNAFIQFFQVRGVSYEKSLKQSFDKWATKRTYTGIHEICLQALMYGQVDEAFRYCDAYVDLPTVVPNLPQTSQYKEFAAAYKALQEKLKTPLATNEKAEEWKGRVGAAGISQGKHYSMLYFNANQVNETKRRLEQLDSNFKAFYLWHALMGVPLQVPAKKMVAILCDEVTQTTQFRDGLDGLPIVSDAFYSPHNDLLVLAPHRMDANGSQFVSLCKGRSGTGWNFDELLRNKMPTIQPQAGKAAEAVQMQMLAVAQQYVTEEGDNAAISREGCRQLLAASNIINRNVQLPIWLEHGIGFFFQRAKGPIYLAKPEGFRMIVGLVTGYGAPNFEQHRAFDTVVDDFLRNPDVTLKNVLSGNYFEGAKTGQDFDPPPPRDPMNPNAGGGVGVPPTNTINAANQNAPDTNEPADARSRRILARLRIKAEASSWALVYYLEKTRLSGLKKFYQELGNMPRDMRLDDELVTKTFCRVFGLMTPSNTIDERALKTFAADWLAYMKNIPHFDFEVPLDAATLDPFATGATQAGTVNPGPGGTPIGGGGIQPPPGGGTPPPPGGGGTPPPPGSPRPPGP